MCAATNKIRHAVNCLADVKLYLKEISLRLAIVCESDTNFSDYEQKKQRKRPSGTDWEEGRVAVPTGLRYPKTAHCFNFPSLADMIRIYGYFS